MKYQSPSRQTWITVGSLLFVFIANAPLLAGDAHADSRPNFLILMADDQFRPTLGCYGAHPSHTANIDQLAREGLRFTHCFTPSSICTANRAVFLSGMLPLKNGAHANHSGFFDGVMSLPNYMRELGYRACLFNKDGIRRPSNLYHWEFKFAESDQPLLGASEPPSRRHLKTRFEEMEAIVAADDDRPFCILHASRLPHTPYMGKLSNGLEGYDASNFNLDQEFGQALNLLKKHDLETSTVVIYVNDNEAGAPRTKYTLYEPGIIVPCIVRWPGHTPIGSATSAMVSFLDFLPTIVELAGGRPDVNWDGKSMLDVWEGKTNEHHQELYFSFTGVSVGGRGRQEIPFPIRGYRTKQYKYIRNLNPTIGHPSQQGLRVPPEELYNIQIDSREQINLADDPNYADLKSQLSAKVNDWMNKTKDRGIESEIEALQRHPPLVKHRP